MAVYAGPEIIENGLVLSLDAGNRKSYSGSGTTWTDLSGNGNNGTLTNGPTYSSSNGGSIVFDGSDDYGSLGSSNNITGNNLQNLTIGVWLKYSNTNIYRSLTIQRGSGGTNSSLIGVSINEIATGQSIGSLGFFTRNSTNTSHIWLSHNDNYHLKNNFINIQCVVDGTNRYLYINGILRNSDSGIGIQSVTNNTDAAYISAGPAGSTSVEKFNGQISNIQFYRRALTAAEIQQNFNALRGRFGI